MGFPILVVIVIVFIFLMNSENGLSMSERAVNINDQMPFYAFNFLNSHYSNNTLYGK